MKLKDLELIAERAAGDRGMKQGREESKLETAREAVLEILTARFGEVLYLVEERIRHLQFIDTLKHLLQRAAWAESRQAFEEELAAIV